MTARFIVADVYDGLAQLEDGSVDLVVTSPPFLALRSYLPADHPDKGKEIGSEATPAEFLDVLLRVTAELRRVLAPHGSIAVELGDTYAGTGGAGGDWSDSEFTSKARVKGGSDVGPTRRVTEDGWPLAKSVCMIPELYRIALAYGRNPLRAPLSARELLAWFERIVEDMRAGGFEPSGTELLRMMTDYLVQYEQLGPYQEYEPWLVRNKVTWCRPNPPVGALGDKWRPATSDVVVACTSPKRYWDDLATRRPLAAKTLTVSNGLQPSAKNSDSPTASHRMDRLNDEGRGAPLLDYWVIPPGGYPGSHYAVFPPELVVPLVKAMCPERVCRTCGEPSRRIVDWGYEDDPNRPGPRGGVGAGREDLTGQNHRGINDPANRQMVKVPRHIAVSDCGHDDYRPGIVLDPFAGSGTTLSVATGHGHDAIGIDLDERNAELALDRVGPLMMEVVG